MLRIMSYETPPRGSGRRRQGGQHWRDDTPVQGTRRPFRDPHPSQTEMDPPMAAEGAPYRERTRQDLVVPRVFVEPDEQMDALRRSCLRWGRVRDAVVVAVGLWLLGSWLLPPVASWLGW